MEIRGIDVSSDNGRPNWAKVKQDGIQFAILRCHQKYGVEASFEYNYKNAVKNGIAVGVYKYSYAHNVEEAKQEAKAVLSTLNGLTLQLPVFYDLEEEFQFQYGKQKIESIAKAFLDEIQNGGYSVGIYCNKNWYNNALSKTLKKYDLWIASVPIESQDTGVMVNHLRPDKVMAWQYSWKGKVSGIEGNVDMDLLIDDSWIKGESSAEEEETSGITAEDILRIMRGWIGLSRSEGTHKVIIDTYNSYPVLPGGYAVNYSDAYCDTTVSAAFIKAGNVDIIGGIECGVERHVAKFIKEGIWYEDGNMVPVPGDIIVFNWDEFAQPNDGFSDHIGIVESVDEKSKTIITIEGNISGGVVGRRTCPIGWGYIRGYARPRYAKRSADGTVEPQKTIAEIAAEVLDGKWGVGSDRIAKLVAAGYDATVVQNMVDEIVQAEAEAKKEVEPEPVEESGSGPSNVPKWVGRVTAYRLNVRTWAGKKYPNIESYPVLSKGNLVDVCDKVVADDDADWYYVRIAGQFYGFVSADFILRA